MKVLTLALFLTLVSPLAAQTVNFAWDPHEQAAEITGFKLYQTKQAGVYTAPSVATFSGGSTVTGSIPQPALGRYYFVLTAYKDDPGGVLESGYSNEVSLVLKPKPPRLTSVIQAIASAPAKAINLLAGLFRNKKSNLRII